MAEATVSKRSCLETALASSLVVGLGICKVYLGVEYFLTVGLGEFGGLS